MLTNAEIVCQSVIKVVRDFIVNQSRYIYPTAVYSYVNDRMYDFADIHMTDEQTLPYLEGKAIISDDSILELAAQVGVSNLFSDDGWVDSIAEHIIKHKADCAELWKYIESNC